MLNGDLLSRPRRSLSLAQKVFTSEFGMGSGGSLSLWPLSKLVDSLLLGVLSKSLKDLTLERAKELKIKLMGTTSIVCLFLTFMSYSILLTKNLEALYDQVNRLISMGKLNALLHLHTPPINVVVCNKSSGRSHLGEGFPLRCFQRLSLPYLATRQCNWHHNRYTSGTFTPVLSY